MLGFDSGGGGGGGFSGNVFCGGLAIRLGGALNTLGGCWWSDFDCGPLGGYDGRTLGGIRTSRIDTHS